ncbi:hypothetical protein [Hymenobacter sp. HDW8]|uniref:hypothetical protein n=1 Tax=Hymenobacter sp. HDW8 TaxID=2714932 RepID=UPI00140CE668|nr:hypothetical protein [Hymenobacter sp. HDW8]QIL74815.1 hypothetical protein G7064_02275 [Hymenobacter sp. HDW8]
MKFLQSTSFGSLLGTLLLSSCLSLQSEEQQAEAAEKAVMAKHDEFMAQMDQLYTLRQQLQRATLPDTTEAGRRRRALLRADAAMMGWMHQYRRPADTVAYEQVMAYFAAQEHKIDSVGRLMRNSIDSARLVLGTKAGNSSNSSTK